MHVKKADEPLAAYVYYPDRLVALPTLRTMFGSLSAIMNTIIMFTQPVFRGLIPSIIKLARNASKNPYRKDLFEGRKDMSVGDYYSHVLGDRGLVDRLLSALVHGVTGGDVWKMSMGSGFLSDYLIPTQQQPITDVLVRSVDFEMMTQLVRNKAAFDLASQHLDAGALWFREGLAALPEALVAALGKNPNVTIKTGTPVRLIDYNGNLDQVAVSIRCAPHLSASSQ
jgi:oxygen-dependent protoporphyrinogen oxidase